MKIWTTLQRLAVFLLVAALLAVLIVVSVIAAFRLIAWFR